MGSGGHGDGSGDDVIIAGVCDYGSGDDEYNEGDYSGGGSDQWW